MLLSALTPHALPLQKAKACHGRRGRTRRGTPRTSKQARTHLLRSIHTPRSHHARSMHTPRSHHARSMHTPRSHHARTTTHALTPRSSHLPHHILKQEVKKQIQFLQMGLDFVSLDRDGDVVEHHEVSAGPAAAPEAAAPASAGSSSGSTARPGISDWLAVNRTYPYSLLVPMPCSLYTCLENPGQGGSKAQCSPNPVPALAAAREQNLHSDGKGGDLPSYQSYPLTTANWAEFASQRQRRDGPGSRGSGGCR